MLEHRRTSNGTCIIITIVIYSRGQFKRKIRKQKNHKRPILGVLCPYYVTLKNIKVSNLPRWDKTNIFKRNLLLHRPKRVPNIEVTIKSVHTSNGFQDPPPNIF